VTIPGKAGEVGDDRIPALGQSIEQSAFADIGSADDGNDRFQGCSLNT
jgi:hypothetical protein